MIILKVAVEAMSQMKISKRYAENRQKFSVSLMVPPHAHNKLTQPMIGSERQELWLLPPR